VSTINLRRLLIAVTFLAGRCQIGLLRWNRGSRLKINNAPDDLGPIDTLYRAFRSVHPVLEDNRPFSAPRHEVITNTPALQERELAKMAALADAQSVHGLYCLSNLNRYAGFFAGRFVLACATSQSLFVSSTNPSPLQVFCPLQSLLALLQADCPLHVLTPTQLSFVSVAAFATPTSALLKSSAAVVAMTAPLLLFAPIAGSSGLEFASEICDLIAVSRPFEIRRYYSFMRDFRHVSRARISWGGQSARGGPPHERGITRAAMAI
jgi:hypothetical protein